MTSPTPYHDWIKSLIATGYANLKFLDEKIMSDSTHTDATCEVVSFADDGTLADPRPAIDSDFDKSLVGKAKRVFIIEGMSKAILERVGSTFDVEPEFFAAHLRSVTWEHHDDKSDAFMLPSIRRQTRFWTLEYLEGVRLDGRFRLGRSRLLPFTPIFRRFFIRNPHKDQAVRHSIGLASRFVSFWEQPSSNGNFDAVILVDAPLEHNLRFEYDDVKKRDPHSATWSPYGGGFVDFANLNQRRNFVQHSPQHPQSRTCSIKEQLLWRLKYPQMFRATDSTPSQIILQRLALSQWALTLAFLRRDFNSVQIRNITKEATSLHQVKETLTDLESCRELLDRCSQLVRKNLTQLNIAVSDETAEALTASQLSTDSGLLQLDWRYIWQECRHWTNETERLLNLRLSNLSVLDSKRSRDDSGRAYVDSQRAASLSESSNQITKLGQILLLVYTPASFAYGLLSMGGNFAPGNKQFWIFFAIAIPLSSLTLLLFYLWVNISNQRNRRHIDNSKEVFERSYI